MPEWLIIARREFAERVRTIWFLIVTLLGPVAMVALLVVPAWLAMRATKDRVVIQVVDRTGRNLFPDLVKATAAGGGNFDLQSVPAEVDEAVLLERVRQEKIDGFLEIPADALAGTSPARYRGSNATNLQLRALLRGAVSLAAVKARAAAAGISSAEFDGFARPGIDVVAEHETGSGQAASGESSFFAGFAVMFILYMSILFYAVNVMRSVIQEKTSRVVEVIISAASPRHLMLGKVIGVGGVGLLQLAIWSTIALLLIQFRGQILALFGLTGSSISLPPLDLIDIVIVLAYFALGYFLYAGLYAAIGAMVNSESEAQQVQTPVVLLLMFPVVCVQLVSNDPRGPAAQLLTAVPFWSPILMPMRYLQGGASVTEVAISLAILFLSIAAVVAIAGRIYRIGILMYGKRPSLRELGRWIRYS